MRSPNELTRRELLAIVDGLQQALYLDFDSRLTKIWNPDKEWEGAEICDYLAALLAGFALIAATSQLLRRDAHLLARERDLVALLGTVERAHAQVALVVDAEHERVKVGRVVLLACLVVHTDGAATQQVMLAILVEDRLCSRAHEALELRAKRGEHRLA